MSSGKASEMVQSFLKAPFGRHKSPSPTKPPDNNVLSGNVVSGSSVDASTTTSKGTAGTASSGIHGGPAHGAGNQSLNPQPPAISAPAKNEAFEKAVAAALQKHVDRLSEDDKAAFQSATDVMEKLGDLQQDNSRISNSHIARVEKVQKDRKSTRLNSSHYGLSRMPSSA